MSNFKNTTKLLAAAVSAAAVLAGVTACGSNGKKAGGDISGAQTAAPTASAAATASPTQASGAPAINLPSDLTVAVDFKPDDDATKKAAADGLAYALRAFQEAAATGNTDSPAFLYSYSGTGAAYMVGGIKQLSSKGFTTTGATRYYALTLDIKDATHAVAAYCNDESKAFAKDKASGKVQETTPGITDYTDWTTALELSDKGVWRVTTTQAEKGSTRCQQAAG
ncbi:hypothetical protein [Kitasatospora griseola]|uniref:hypothetical protein n=1 Tax=Kitasatospora griseola TaxID=2064 RepID=UPI00343D6E3B